MHSTRRRRLLLAAALAVSATSLALAAGTQASSSDHGGRQTLSGTKPAWASVAPTLGTVSETQSVSAKVWLAPRNASGLDALARAVGDPSSSQYRQYLTESQYRAQFAPTDAQVASVRQWLEGAGLHVDSVGPDAHFLAVSGSAAAASTAFGTQLSNFAVNGKTVAAPASDFSVP